MRVVFFGTPAFAVPTLEALLTAGHDVAAVVTQPDRPRTRSHSTLLPSPVKARALDAGITVFQPDRPRGEEFTAALRDLDADLGVVVAYGHLLRPELLAIPRLGMVNVHASLLPRWRGAAPIQWAVISGDRETGVSIMRMEAGLDSGPVWLARRTPIAPDETSGDLFARLATLGAEALLEALPAIAAGEEPLAQDESQVTLAPKIDREQARIDWNQPADRVSALLRGMDPAPGAWTTLDGQPVKLFRPGDPVATEQLPVAGTIVSRNVSLAVACADALLPIGDIQPAGRRRVTTADWLRGMTRSADAAFA